MPRLQGHCGQGESLPKKTALGPRFYYNISQGARIALLLRQSVLENAGAAERAQSLSGRQWRELGRDRRGAVSGAKPRTNVRGSVFDRCDRTIFESGLFQLILALAATNITNRERTPFAARVLRLRRTFVTLPAIILTGCPPQGLRVAVKADRSGASGEVCL